MRRHSGPPCRAAHRRASASTSGPHRWCACGARPKRRRRCALQAHPAARDRAAPRQVRVVRDGQRPAAPHHSARASFRRRRQPASDRGRMPKPRDSHRARSRHRSRRESAPDFSPRSPEAARRSSEGLIAAPRNRVRRRRSVAGHEACRVSADAVTGEW